MDEILVDVDYIAGKTGKTLYTSSIVTTNGVFGPYGMERSYFRWKTRYWINHLALAIAEKLK